MYAMYIFLLRIISFSFIKVPTAIYHYNNHIIKYIPREINFFFTNFYILLTIKFLKGKIFT